MEEQRRLEEARLAEEAALAIAEKEKARSEAALEHAEAAQGIAELEAQKRRNAEIKDHKEAEEKDKVLDALAKSDVRYRKYSIEELETATDSRKITVSAGAQTHDLQMIVHEIISEGIKVDEQMQVAAIIDKLPNSWKEFQKGLRHKQSELSIVNLMARLQIEEEARKQDKKNETLANNTHANHANSHQGNGNANGNGAKNNVVVESMDVIFHEDKFPYKSKDSGGEETETIESSQPSQEASSSQTHSLITAKPPMGLTHHVEKAIERGSFAEMLDQTVPDWPVEEALSFAKMALKCAELRRKDRPDLGKVVMPELERLRALAEENMSHSTLYSAGPSPTNSQVSMSQENLSYPMTAPSDYSSRSRSSTGT
ncbi:hypothetical protein RJ639_035221 [Escallonia herrerae]|uniref:RING-type E3 ubiquitin transferase n=1 Tax=Escallonia herrerae TaxID=1293975 RepID=A0AA88WUK0_9ASTE|nr:hypothetical protein RJ639_035221 [Escallonia herrerae]